MITKIEIRPAAPVHVDSIAGFLQPFVAAKEILPRTRGELLMLIRLGFVAWLPQEATNDEEIVGFGSVEIYSPKLAEIQCLAVAESCRGMGIGRDLVQRCVSVAEEKGVIELMAITSNENIFRSCGFDYSMPQQKRALFIQTGDRTNRLSDRFFEG